MCYPCHTVFYLSNTAININIFFIIFFYLWLIFLFFLKVWLFIFFVSIWIFCSYGKIKLTYLLTFLLTLFIPFLTLLILSAIQHLFCDSFHLTKRCSEISYFFYVRLFVVLKFFIQLLVHVLSCWNNLFNLHCSILLSYILILLVLACSVCFSSSKITFNQFFLTLNLRSIISVFFFSLIAPRF